MIQISKKSESHNFKSQKLEHCEKILVWNKKLKSNLPFLAKFDLMLTKTLTRNGQNVEFFIRPNNQAKVWTIMKIMKFSSKR